jgi:hypothetical protein
MVVSSGEWSAPISQLIAVAWCCSTRRMRASSPRRSRFMRAAMCEKRLASSSRPFIRMMRTRVNASSSSLLIGACTSSRQVKRWRSIGVPWMSLRRSAIGVSSGAGDSEATRNGRASFHAGRYAHLRTRRRKKIHCGTKKLRVARFHGV